jgi:tetratricopeptide (TPR) repeat protein
MRQSIIISIIVLIPLMAIAENAEYYFDIGNTKFGLDDKRGAIEDYNKAIELDPTLSKIVNIVYHNSWAEGF